MFWKKKKSAPRRYYIPEEYLEKFCELRDEYNAAPKGQNYVLALGFWRFIEKATGVDIRSSQSSRKNWRIGGPVLHPYIEEYNREW